MLNKSSFTLKDRPICPPGGDNTEVSDVCNFQLELPPVPAMFACFGWDCLKHNRIITACRNLGCMPICLISSGASASKSLSIDLPLITYIYIYIYIWREGEREINMHRVNICILFY